MAILLPSVSFPSLQTLELEGPTAEECMEIRMTVLKLSPEVCSVELEIQDQGAFQDLPKFVS